MPVRERFTKKELFGPWLLRQIDSRKFEGVCWLDDACTLFRLPWKHLSMKNVDEKDIAIFKEWAIHSGKYNPNCVDLPTYKTNFRCALKAVCNKDRNKMFSKHEDKASDQHDPHKIFRYHRVHGDTSTAVVPPTTSNSTNEAATNFQNEIEHDEHYRLRISPDVERTNPFMSRDDSAIIEQLLCNFILNSDDEGAQQVLDIIQEDYSQDIPRVDHVFRESVQEPNLAAAEPYNNGHEQPFPNIHSQLIHEQCSPYPVYVMCPNGHMENFPAFARVFQPITACSQPAPSACNFVETLFDEANPCQYGFQHESTQHMMNQDATTHSPNYACDTNGEMSATQPQENTPSTFSEQEAAPQQSAVTLVQSSKVPKLTSWEVTVLYRGKEVFKQNVSSKFYINHTGCVPHNEPANVVTFPSPTDTLVDQFQIQYTNTILNSVGSGLLLDVNPHDFKLYATRMGNSRVYWGMSGSLETRENVSHATKLDRDVPTAIFDFNQFLQELKDYEHHQRPSPDYTIYLSFGQNLFEPIKKALVLVKLVPSFCTFLHQCAQEGGASSLHSELLSLQISNGSSFNCLDVPCLMDLDLSDLPGLF